MDILWAFLAPIISILPAFTVIGTLVSSTIIFVVLMVVYYVASTTIFVIPCAYLNMVLWPVGLILSIFRWPFGYTIAYIIAFVLMMLNGKRTRER